MTKGKLLFIIGPPLLFTSIVFFWQTMRLIHPDPTSGPYQFTIPGMYDQEQRLAGTTDIMKADANGDRTLDPMLPKNARIFMTEMTGLTNFWKRDYFYCVLYYVFPREVAMSLDGPAQQTREGFRGKGNETYEEIAVHGYNVLMAIDSTGLKVRMESGSASQAESNPSWFGSTADFVIALLLPLFSTWSGMLLLRLLFPRLNAQMPLLEQLGCGLGLGMMAVTALTLGVKLCGFHGYHLVFWVTQIGAVVEVWLNRKCYLPTLTSGALRLAKNPVSIATALAGLVIFLLLFRLAGLMWPCEYDALMSWALKAKILYLFAGKDLVHWFSNPGLAHAHLDYPPLVPCLHSATYDSIGHVDEFVTKFWPTWMLVFLIAALVSLAATNKGRINTVGLVLLGIVLTPSTLLYVRYEGGTMPMAFFMALGCLQIVFWLEEKDPNRLGLGLVLLFGAAMTKIEGCIFLLCVAGSIPFLLRFARSTPWLWPRFWPALLFCFLTALPFICLRVQMPSLNSESNWVGNMLHNPGPTLMNWPAVFLMMVARLFLNISFAEWIEDNGHFRWTGHWFGLHSLYDPASFGLAWLCLAMTAVLWLAFPQRRIATLWTLAMVVAAVGALSGISSGFVNAHSAEHLVDMGQLTPRYYIPMLESTPRYFFPTLLTWFVTTLAMLFGMRDRSEPPTATPVGARMRKKGASVGKAAAV